MKRAVQLTIWIWLFVVGTAVAQTQTITITLQPARDATIYEQGNNNPNGGEVGNSGGMYLLAGRTSRYGVRRPLLQFDVASALPPDAVVTNAILNLTLQQWYLDSNGEELVGINLQMFAHRVLSDWGVGTSGDGTTSLGGGGYEATLGDVTWTDRFYGVGTDQSWGTAGGDFAPEPSGNGLIWPQIEGRSFSWSDPEMADDVNSWLANPADNHGWIMLANEVDEQSIVRFYASEWTEVDERPQLFLIYERGGGGDVPTAVSVSSQQTAPMNAKDANNTVLIAIMFIIVIGFSVSSQKFRVALRTWKMSLHNHDSDSDYDVLQS